MSCRKALGVALVLQTRNLRKGRRPSVSLPVLAQLLSNTLALVQITLAETVTGFGTCGG
jgi:hypothetical protein